MILSLQTNGKAILLTPQTEDDHKLLRAIYIAILDGGYVTVTPNDGGPSVSGFYAGPGFRLPDGPLINGDDIST
jgi:hypothetical protein